LKIENQIILGKGGDVPLLPMRFIPTDSSPLNRKPLEVDQKSH
jgi:hypothetical protein